MEATAIRALAGKTLAPVRRPAGLSTMPFSGAVRGGALGKRIDRFYRLRYSVV